MIQTSAKRSDLDRSRGERIDIVNHLVKGKLSNFPRTCTDVVHPQLSTTAKIFPNAT